jgi:hypothetical protein
MKHLVSALAVIVVVAAGVPVLAQDSKLAPLVGPYVKVQEMLAADSIQGLGEQSSEISRAALALGPQASGIVAASKTLTGAGSIETARQAFGELTTVLFKYADDNKLSLGPGVRRAYCPMVKKSWAQKDGQIANPYAGKKMLRCGDFTDGKG